MYENRVRFFWGFARTRVRQYLSGPAGRRAETDLPAPAPVPHHRSSGVPYVAASIIRALHRADDHLASLRGLPRQIMFEAANPMLFNVFRPVYQRLSADPRIAITLVPYWRGVRC